MASAAASEIAPRMPAQPTSRRSAGRIGGGSSREGPGISRRRSGLTVYVHADAQADDDAGGERDSEGPRGRHRRSCDARRAMPPQLQPDQQEQSRLEQEDEHVPERLRLQVRARAEELVERAPGIQARADGRDHAGRPRPRRSMYAT